jgi:hypothetical protein
MESIDNKNIDKDKDKLSSNKTSANSSYINEPLTSKTLFTEDFKKLQLSDTTSILSDSSEGYCESSDSDTRSIRSMKNFNKNKFSSMETEYPKDIKEQRSKSQRFKKRYTESVVVNEENNEEENETENPVRRKRLDFSSASYNDDLPSKFKKTKSKMNNSSSQPSFKSRLEKMENINSLSVNFDTVVEDKEEEKDNIIRGLSLGLNSPRVLFMTDNTEDSTITPWNGTALHVPRDYGIEEVIAEDNNENYIEEIKKPIRDGINLHKNALLMDGVVDKEENILLDGLMNVNVNVNGVDNVEFEPIKEENVEEEDKENNIPKLKHNKSSKCKLKEKEKEIEKFFDFFENFQFFCIFLHFLTFFAFFEFFEIFNFF